MSNVRPGAVIMHAVRFDEIGAFDVDSAMSCVPLRMRYTMAPCG